MPEKPMKSLNTVAAEVLETSAAGLAAAAVAELEPSSAAYPSADAASWKTHFVQRILDLAAAVRVEQPALFARRIGWLRRAAVARGANDLELRRALRSLRVALQREVPQHLHATIAPALELAVAAFDDVITPSAMALDAADRHGRIALRYLAACLEGDPQRASALVLEELERGLSPADAYARVLLAAEREIGELWHIGDVSVAEERLVSETTRELMTLIVARYSPAAANGLTLVAAAVASNAHDIGLRAVVDLFRLAGWRCLFLGANIPAEEIARAAEIFDANLVVLNATLTTQLKPLEDAIQTIRSLAPTRRVLVGGLAFDGAPDLWKKLGADAYAASVLDAVAAGAKAVTS
jgi:methanogenic corrinoid protein MtbC1